MDFDVSIMSLDDAVELKRRLEEKIAADQRRQAGRDGVQIAKLFPIAKEFVDAYYEVRGYFETVRLEVRLGDVVVVSTGVQIDFVTDCEDLDDITSDWAKAPINSSIFGIRTNTEHSAFAKKICDVLSHNGNGVSPAWIKTLSPKLLNLVLNLAKLRQKLDRDAAEANGWSGDEVIAAYLDHRNEEQVEAFHD